MNRLSEQKKPLVVLFHSHFSIICALSISLPFFLTGIRTKYRRTQVMIINGRYLLNSYVSFAKTMVINMKCRNKEKDV